MLNSKPLTDLIFIDLETIPAHKSFFDLSEIQQELFLKKFKKESEEMLKQQMDDWDIPALKDYVDLHPKIEKFYNNRAALHAEFCQIICICIGWIKAEEGVAPALYTNPTPAMELKFGHKTFSGDDEKALLKAFHAATASVIDTALNPKKYLVAHNGLNFDFPVLARKFIMHGLPLPAMLDMDGKKEWNLPYLIDTRRVWGMNVYDGGISMALLCEALGVPSPKSDIQGSEVRDVYYIEKNLKRIAEYCLQDTFRLGECYLRMKSLPNKLILNLEVPK